jgi:myosin heavy subunit
LLETIRIRKHGYPIRLPYADFASRYKCLNHIPRGLDPRDATRILLRETPPGEFQPGTTKIFLRESLEQKLEQRLHNLYHTSAVLLQKTVRSYLARKRFNRMKASAVVIQAYWRMKRDKKFYDELKKSALIVQRGWRRVRKKHTERKTRSRVMGCVVGGVNHLEVPAELAFVLSKIDGKDR